MAHLNFPVDEPPKSVALSCDPHSPIWKWLQDCGVIHEDQMVRRVVLDFEICEAARAYVEEYAPSEIVDSSPPVPFDVIKLSIPGNRKRIWFLAAEPDITAAFQGLIYPDRESAEADLWKARSVGLKARALSALVEVE